MNQFIQDMIHMTEGEKFIKYWWLWLSIFLIMVIPWTVWRLLRDRNPRIKNGRWKL